MMDDFYSSSSSWKERLKEQFAEHACRAGCIAKLRSGACPSSHYVLYFFTLDLGFHVSYKTGAGVIETCAIKKLFSSFLFLFRLFDFKICTHSKKSSIFYILRKTLIFTLWFFNNDFCVFLSFFWYYVLSNFAWSFLQHCNKYITTRNRFDHPHPFKNIVKMLTVFIPACVHYFGYRRQGKKHI